MDNTFLTRRKKSRKETSILDLKHFLFSWKTVLIETLLKRIRFYKFQAAAELECILKVSLKFWITFLKINNLSFKACHSIFFEHPIIQIVKESLITFYGPCPFRTWAIMVFHNFFYNRFCLIPQTAAYWEHSVFSFTLSVLF